MMKKLKNKHLSFLRYFILCVTAGLFSTSSFADNARDWQNMPINTPVLFAYYFHIDSNTSLDTALPIKNADSSIDAGMLRFGYSFDMGNGKTSGIQIIQPFADVDVTLGNRTFEGDKGMGDTTFVFATNLFGGPALTVDKFSAHKPGTFMSAAIGVTAPTGSYDSKKLINLGANRWAFKPEIAFGHPFGNSWIETNAWVQFYTDNKDHLGDKTLKQDPKIGLEAHYSYNFTRAFWMSADLFYTHGGKTKVNNFVESAGGNTWQAGIGGQLMLTPKDAISFAYMNTISKPDGAADVKTYMLSYMRLFF